MAVDSASLDSELNLNQTLPLLPCALRPSAPTSSSSTDRQPSCSQLFGPGPQRTEWRAAHAMPRALSPGTVQDVRDHIQHVIDALYHDRNSVGQWNVPLRVIRRLEMATGIIDEESASPGATDVGEWPVGAITHRRSPPPEPERLRSRSPPPGAGRDRPAPGPRG